MQQPNRLQANEAGRHRSMYEHNSSACFVDYLEAQAEQIGLSKPGARILELGSGVGWLGMCLAHNLPQASLVQCTEQEQGGAMEWLRENIERNSHLSLHNLRTAALDWSRYDNRGSESLAASVAWRGQGGEQGRGESVSAPFGSQHKTRGVCARC